MIIQVGCLPPPIYGASLITESVKNRMVARGVRLVVCNTSERLGSRGLVYFLTRAAAYFRSYCTILKQARRSEKRAVYVSLSGRLGLIYDLVLVTVARLTGCDMIFHHHTFSYIADPSPFLKMIVKIAGGSQIHIALCPSMARKLREVYGAELRVELMSNLAFVDLPDAKAAAATRPLGAIGYLSNVSFAKGIDRYLDLLVLLRAKGSQLKGKIAGPFDDDSVRQYVERRMHEIGDVDYAGAVYAERKSAFLGSIDLLVFPSRLNEGQPVVIFEALAAGIPAVAPAVGCIGDIVDPVSAVLFDPKSADLDALAERILAWEKDPASFDSVARQLRGRFATLVEQCAAEVAHFDTIVGAYR
jgi:glycosyltransferase involved in cell wall biosynthesis